MENDEADVGYALEIVCTFDDPRLMDPGLIVVWGIFDNYITCHERLAPQFAYLKDFIRGNRWVKEADILQFAGFYNRWTNSRRQKISWIREMFTRKGHRAAKALWKELFPLRLKLEDIATTRVVRRLQEDLANGNPETTEPDDHSHSVPGSSDAGRREHESNGDMETRQLL
ncbi:hypothetical protein M407DRAFT_242684 [Tulasnella calospora MUT 4182]|uniref:Uncharacterized protein n=1 Tax=Tulasnella calospora MUT 4182 TaxID=1051891 RepID=A0A0C3QPQ5_9AGAM|nr:hypothetical protein M407DRAFT_242684 [Tulasnella calospora MUT 4182]